MRVRRVGFTLVEVALAVAVGLIIVGGAVLTYQTLRHHASDLLAHDRLTVLQTCAEEYAAANAGVYPTASRGDLARMWSRQRPDDKNQNPWGGTTLNASGVIERGPATGGTSSSAAASFDTTAGFPIGTSVPAQRGMMMYVSATNAGPWIGATISETGTWTPVKGYAVATFDAEGMPYWDVKGGK